MSAPDAGPCAAPDAATTAARSAQIRRVILAHARDAAANARFGLSSRVERSRAIGDAAAAACEELGPSFVKLGQIASVRADIVDPVVAERLERLRDDVAPMTDAELDAVFARTFGRSPEQLFATFERTPVAAASIAQVHRATLPVDALPAWGAVLPAGTPVAVKVVRPHAFAALCADIAAARAAITRLPKRWGFEKVDWDGLVDELERSVARELDMRAEGRAADGFRFALRDEPRVVIPRVAWAFTGPAVLTMEFIEGWPMSRLDEARAAGVDTRSLAVVGANAFMRQVLVEGRYHADLHHANLLVTPDERVAYLDFGMVGELADRERREVARLLAALVFGDADAALVHTERLGVRIPADRLPALRSGLDALMGRTLESGGSDLAAFGLGLLKLLRDAGVSVPSGYTLLVKALVTVEGVSRELYPEIDMIATAAPFATEVVLREGLDAETLRRRMPAALRAAVRALLAEG